MVHFNGLEIDQQLMSISEFVYIPCHKSTREWNLKTYLETCQTSELERFMPLESYKMIYKLHLAYLVRI